MKRFLGRRALALATVPLILALLGVALFMDAPIAAATAAPTVAVTGDPAPGNTVMVTGANWPADDPITITYDGTALAITSAKIHRSIVGQIGTAAFSEAVQIPLVTTIGAHTIAATDPRTGDTAQTAITVIAEWSQYGFTAANSRYNPNETAIGVGNVANLTPAWTYQPSGFQCTSPGIVTPSVAQGNVIFVSQENCQFVSLNAATGAQNWTKTNYYLSSFAQPAINDVFTYVPASYLVASESSTGATLWQSVGGAYQVTPVFANGKIYMTSFGLAMYNATGCEKAACAPMWNYSPPGAVTMIPAVANGSVYYGNYNLPTGGSGLDGGSHLISVDTLTGAFQWAGAVGSYQEMNTTAVDNGYVVFTANIPQGYPGSPGGTLYVFNAAGCGQTICQPLWTAYNAAGWGVGTAEANGVIYVGGLDNALYAFAEAACGQATCAPLWQSASLSQTASRVAAAPAVANGVVYYTSGPTGEALAYEAKGCLTPPCSPIWSYTLGLGSAVTSNASPIIVAGMLYVSDSNNVLYAFHLPATASRSGASATSPTNPETPATSAASPRGPGQPARSPHHLLWYRDSWLIGPQR